MKLIKNGNVISLGTSIEEREHKYLKHIASALSHYLENPQGSELICVLGSGYEQSNRQALETWVFYHRDEVFQKRLEGMNPLEYLIDHIEQLTRG